MLKRFGFALVVLLLVAPVSGVAAASRCQGIFAKPHYVALPANDPILSILKAIDTQAPNLVRTIHVAILKAAADPQIRDKYSRYIYELKQAEYTHANRASSPAEIKSYLEQVRFLLRLSVKDVELWKAMLSRGEPEAILAEFNLRKTVGHLLRLLPEAQKNEILDYLGQSYAKEKNHNLLPIIHLLLNPRALYAKMKSQGHSDREFYDAYLELVRSKVFKSPSSADPIVNYSTDVVIEIAKVIQRDAIYDKVEIVNFFGSVPNGFARKTSDLDIFNQPSEALVKQLEGKELWHDVLKRDIPLIDMHRYEITGEKIEKGIDDLLRATPWAWKPQKEGIRLRDDNFGLYVHPFSFRITKDEIVLRFAADLLQIDAQGNPLVRTPIELNVTGPEASLGR